MTESVIGNFSESFRHLIPPEKVQAFPHAQAYGLKRRPLTKENDDSFLFLF